MGSFLLDCMKNKARAQDKFQRFCGCRRLCNRMSCILSIYFSINFVVKILELLDHQSGQAQSQAMGGLASSSSLHNQFPSHHHSGLLVAASQSAAATAPTPDKASSAAAATALLNLPGITIQPQRTEPEAPPANATPGGGGASIKTERGEVAEMLQITAKPVRTGCLITILT